MNNQDLVWRLNRMEYPEKAVSFLKRFENAFCVYSKNVKQLYSNYELHRVNTIKPTVVALPNPYAHLDTFSFVIEKAIIPTSFIVAPGDFKDIRTWVLCYKHKGERKWKGIDFKKGINKFKYAYGESDPLLPVIINTSLRESAAKQSPLMQLHRIKIDELATLSSLQQNDIQSTVEDKLRCA